MKRGRKTSTNADEYMNGFDYSYNEMSEDNFETQSNNIDIESIVNKLDLYMPLHEIAAEENITMTSLIKCIDYLREQKVNIDTNYYEDSLNLYSMNEIENNLEEF